MEELIALFREQHPEYQDPDKAEGHCGEATDSFLSLVESFFPRADTGEVHFASSRVCRAQQAATDACWDVIPMFPYKKGPSAYRAAGNRDVGDDLGGHIVARVGTVCIDWTARQYDRYADYPLIFNLPAR